MPQIDLAHVVAIDLHETAIVSVDPLQEPRQRRFSGPTASDYTQHRARGHRKGDAVKRRNFRVGVGKAYVVEGDRAGEWRTQSAGNSIVFQRTVQHRCSLADRGADLLEIFD